MSHQLYVSKPLQKATTSDPQKIFYSDKGIRVENNIGIKWCPAEDRSFSFYATSVPI